MREYKMSLACEKCNYSAKTAENFSPAALEFHHVKNDKDFTISYAASCGYGIKRLKKEIDKCVVLCARCHTEIHDEIRNTK